MTLARLGLSDGTNLIPADMVRALQVDAVGVRFVIYAPSPDIAKLMERVRRAAEDVVGELS